MSNIYDHITIIMCIIKFYFIDKESLKELLKELVIKNYLTIVINDTYKMYNLNIQHIIMDEINKNINTNTYIHQIMTISRETYYRTAVFYNVTLFLLFLYQQ